MLSLRDKKIEKYFGLGVSRWSSHIKYSNIAITKTTLWPENVVTLSRQYCRVPSSACFALQKHPSVSLLQFFKQSLSILPIWKKTIIKMLSKNKIAWQIPVNITNVNTCVKKNNGIKGNTFPISVQSNN